MDYLLNTNHEISLELKNKLAQIINNYEIILDDENLSTQDKIDIYIKRSQEIVLFLKENNLKQSYFNDLQTLLVDFMTCKD